MERLIAIPIENALNGLDDVRQITSGSRAGVATISVEFIYGSDPEKKYDEVVRELNVVRPRLPDGVTLVRATVAIRRRPTSCRWRSSAKPRRFARWTGTRAAARCDRTRAGRAACRNLGRAARGSARCGRPRSARRLSLAAHRGRRRAHARRPRHCRSARSNPAVGASTSRRRARSTASMKSAASCCAQAKDRSSRSATSPTSPGPNDERRHITRFNGQRALFVTARAKLGATVFDVIDGVRAQVDGFEPRLPPDIRLDRGFDQAETVEHRLGSLGRDFAIAIGLVLLTLLPLGFRASLVVMVSIPLSLSMGVVALQYLGYSLNQLSIAGLRAGARPAGRRFDRRHREHLAPICARVSRRARRRSPACRRSTSR